MVQHMNNEWYLRGDTEPVIDLVQHAQKKYVGIYQTWTLDSVPDLPSFCFPAIRSKQNIDEDEELYVGYGRSYEFSLR